MTPTLIAEIRNQLQIIALSAEDTIRSAGIQRAVNEIVKLLPMDAEPSEGSTCGIPCPGVLAFPPVENCSCHLNPPCGACVNNPLTCSECGWESERP